MFFQMISYDLLQRLPVFRRCIHLPRLISRYLSPAFHDSQDLHWFQGLQTHHAHGHYTYLKSSHFPIC
ncbi:hypothetical protein Hanom_Chr05g00405081 [Helianthus anomalus]